MQRGLKAVHRLEPREVLDIAERLRKIPSDDHSVRQFLLVMSSQHSRLEEDTDRWDRVDQCAGSFTQLIEAGDRNTTRTRRPAQARTADGLLWAEAYGSRCSHRE